MLYHSTRLGYPSLFFILDFPIEMLYKFLIPVMCDTYPVISILLNFITLIFWESFKLRRAASFCICHPGIYLFIFGPNILPSAPCLKIPFSCVSLEEHKTLIFILICTNL